MSTPTVLSQVCSNETYQYQPNLVSRSEVLSIYKCLNISEDPFPKFGAQKRQMFDHFFATVALDTAYLRNKT